MSGSPVGRVVLQFVELVSFKGTSAAYRVWSVLAGNELKGKEVGARLVADFAVCYVCYVVAGEEKGESVEEAVAVAHHGVDSVVGWQGMDNFGRGVGDFG